MRVCPVCEAAVAGWECEVCGHLLGQVPSPVVAAERLPDLEVRPAAGPRPVEGPMPDLEGTRFAPAPSVRAVPEPGWETSGAAPTPDVPAGGLEELDSGREPGGAERTAVPEGPVTCRYCRNVQASGLLCERCGMRLPWPARPTLAEAPAPAGTDELVRCARCGERTYPAARCGSCGALLAAPA
ncbi:MAG TPA: hypothetical protein VK454_08695 [Myxococcaceae bacterium]|nr:hypothetical protein [Myxococcaceae bacterium]